MIVLVSYMSDGEMPLMYFGLFCIFLVIFGFVFSNDRTDEEQFLEFTKLTEQDHIADIARYFEIKKYSVDRCKYSCHNYTGHMINYSYYEIQCHFRDLLKRESVWLSKRYENNTLYYNYYG